MKVVEWYLKHAHLAQTIWSGLEYAFLSEDNRQCGPFVYCKEFLIDSIWSQINQTPISIYGFHYNPYSDPAICMTSSRILLRNMDDMYFDRRVQRSLQFINKIEEELKFPQSTFEECENVPYRRMGSVYLLTSSPDWLHAPPLVSMLTLMIRSGMVYNGTDPWKRHLQKVRDKEISLAQKKDSDHLKIAYPAIVDLVETKCARLGNDQSANWPPESERVDFWWMHEYSGIVSLANGTARRINRAWYPKPKFNVAERMRDVLPILKKGIGDTHFPDLRPECEPCWSDTHALLQGLHYTAGPFDNRDFFNHDKFKEDFLRLVRSFFPDCEVKCYWKSQEVEVS